MADSVKSAHLLSVRIAVERIADRAHPQERELTGFEPWVLDALLDQGAQADDPLSVLLAEEEAELLFFGASASDD